MNKTQSKYDQERFKTNTEPLTPTQGHTPGSWVVTPPNGSHDPFVEFSICCSMMRIADVQRTGRDDAAANAHLIAAAPDLLEACKMVVERVLEADRVTLDELDQVKAAIERAEKGGAV